MRATSCVIKHVTRVHCTRVAGNPACATRSATPTSGSVPGSTAVEQPQQRLSQATAAPTGASSPTPSASARLPLPFNHTVAHCHSQSQMWPDVRVELVAEALALEGLAQRDQLISAGGGRRTLTAGATTWAAAAGTAPTAAAGPGSATAAAAVGGASVRRWRSTSLATAAAVLLSLAVGATAGGAPGPRSSTPASGTAA